MPEQSMDMELLPFYERLSKQGTQFFVENKLMNPQKAFKKAYVKAVEEESIYMSDYIMGDAGNIKEVRIHRVDPE